MSENIIWSVEIDEGKFNAWVVSTEQHKGILFVESADKLSRFTKEVTVSYGAPFGADIEDVNLWTYEALNFIDNL